MAHYIIEKIVRADGVPLYRCSVVIKEKGKVLFRESSTVQINDFYGLNLTVEHVKLKVVDENFHWI